MISVDFILKEYFFSLDEDLIKDAAIYCILEGKMIRSKLFKQFGKMFGTSDKDSAIFGAAIESVHCYSLIHDDLPSMDNSAVRRGKPSCHVKYGECYAILTGDAMSSAAFEILCGSETDASTEKKIRAMHLLAKSAGFKGMVGGQSKDMQIKNMPTDQVTKDLIQTINSMKTGAIFSACCAGAAILGDASEAEIELSSEFGKLFGIAFQNIDDARDNDYSKHESLESANDMKKKSLEILKQINRNTKEMELFCKENLSTEI